MTQRLIPAYAASHRPGLQLLPTQSYREYQTMSNDSTIDLTGESLHFISIDPVPARIAVQVDTSNFEQGRGCLSLRAVGGSSDGVITVQFMLGRTMATELTLNVKSGITTLFVLGYHVDAEHQIHLDLISVADQPVPISGGGETGTGTAVTTVNGNYADGVLTNTGGELLAGTGVLGFGLHSPGLHKISFVMPSISQTIYGLYADALTDFSGIGSAVLLGAVIQGNGALTFSVDYQAAGTLQLNTGDQVEITLTDTTVTATVNGGAVHAATRSLSTPLGADATTHVACIGDIGSVTVALH